MISQDIPNPIVFSAFKNDGKNFYAGDYLNNYDGFNTNYGNSFDLASGIFTSPRKGMFEFFAATVHADIGLNSLMVEKNNIKAWYVRKTIEKVYTDLAAYKFSWIRQDSF